MNEIVLISRAAQFAVHRHSNQRRKGEAAEPYANHLAEVAALVADATDGRDANLVAAAWLHDAIEDQRVSRAAIAEEFGEDIASLVVEVTDDKALPKEERKELQVTTVAAKTPRARLLTIADKTSNLTALVDSPPADWLHERRLDYVRWARSVVDAGCRGLNAALEDRFDAAACRAEQAWKV